MDRDVRTIGKPVKELILSSNKNLPWSNFHHSFYSDQHDSSVLFTPSFPYQNTPLLLAPNPYFLKT